MKPLIRIVFLCIIAIHPVYAQFQSPKIILSYDGITQFGLNNRDSVEQALGNLGIPTFDTIDRNRTGSDTTDYTPYNILIWSTGDPTIDVVPGEATGQAGLSAKEIFEVKKFLKAGESDCKKSLIMAGQNIAYEHGFLMPNGISVDTEFLQSWLHVKFVANSPDAGIYRGSIVGQQPAYWTFPDSMISTSPDVVHPSLKTPDVGPVVNQVAYFYSDHAIASSDSGAGVSFYNPLINTVFYAFDWADPVQTFPHGNGDTTSGTTRILGSALAFIRSHFQLPSCTASSVVMENNSEPALELSAIVPNPAHIQTEVFFTLNERSFVTISILDLLGRIIRTEVEQFSMNTGAWSKTLDLTNIPAGNYTCELVAKGTSKGTSVITENFIVQ